MMLDNSHDKNASLSFSQHKGDGQRDPGSHIHTFQEPGLFCVCVQNLDQSHGLVRDARETVPVIYRCIHWRLLCIWKIQ